MDDFRNYSFVWVNFFHLVYEYWPKPSLFCPVTKLQLFIEIIFFTISNGHFIGWGIKFQFGKHIALWVPRPRERPQVER